MDVGETPTLLEVDWVFDTRWAPDLDDKGWGWENMRTFWKRAPGSWVPAHFQTASDTKVLYELDLGSERQRLLDRASNCGSSSGLCPRWFSIWPNFFEMVSGPGEKTKIRDAIRKAAED